MKASIPQGTRDFSPQILHKRNYILDTIKQIFQLYCFQPLETPAMENLATLAGKYGEEGDKLMFKILNNGLSNPQKLDKTKAAFEQVLAGKSDLNITERALRYDLTIPFARYVAMNSNDIAFPFKRYQMQPVWRADRPQKGRYREFWQCDADVVGSESLLNEAELLAIYREAFTQLNIPNIEIKINNRKILAGIANACGAGEQLTNMTVAIDKLDKIGIDGVIKELQERGFEQHQIDLILQFLNIRGDNQSKMEQLRLLVNDNELINNGLEELTSVLTLHGQLADKTWTSELSIDFNLARGLNYYTGTIVEVVTHAVEMGSIGGGGRYDDLTSLFDLKGMSGVGVSFGIDRIYDVMEQLHLFPDTTSQQNILVLNIDDAAFEKSLDLVKSFRNHNIAIELYPAKTKLDKQLKYAHKRNIQNVIICGEQELAENVFIVKDMLAGTQTTMNKEALLQHFL